MNVESCLSPGSTWAHWDSRCYSMQMLSILCCLGRCSLIHLHIHFLSFQGGRGKLRDENTFQTTVFSASLWWSGNVIRWGEGKVGCCDRPFQGINASVLDGGRGDAGEQGQKGVHQVPRKTKNTRCFSDLEVGRGWKSLKWLAPKLFKYF